jgi:hypothetical protein
MNSDQHRVRLWGYECLLPFIGSLVLVSPSSAQSHRRPPT